MSAAGRFFKGALARTFGVAATVGTAVTLGFTGYEVFDNYRDSLNARGPVDLLEAFVPVVIGIPVAAVVGFYVSRKVGRIVESTMMDWLLPPQPPKPRDPSPAPKI